MNFPAGNGFLQPLNHDLFAFLQPALNRLNAVGSRPERYTAFLHHSVLFHDYLWQVLFILMVAFLWLLWIDKVVHRAGKIAVSR